VLNEPEHLDTFRTLNWPLFRGAGTNRVRCL
jgi:hypothetical protein